MNITLTGNLGSGKSSVCKELQALGWEIVSSGDIFRGIAKERGISVESLNEIAKTDKAIDQSIDERSTRLGKEMDHTVFDSRLAWHFVEESFKVFLLVDTLEAAIRVFSGTSRDAEDYGSLDDAQKGLRRRADLERTRFQEIYGIDYYDKNNYDLIIESTYATPAEIAAMINQCCEEYQSSRRSGRLLLNTKGLLPTVPVSEISADNGKIRVAAKDGYHYIISGHAQIVSAIRSGNAFFETDGLHRDAASTDRVSVPTEAEIKDYENAAGFSFKKFPSKDVVHEEYLMDIYL